MRPTQVKFGSKIIHGYADEKGDLYVSFNDISIVSGCTGFFDVDFVESHCNGLFKKDDVIEWRGHRYLPVGQFVIVLNCLCYHHYYSVIDYMKKIVLNAKYSDDNETTL